MYSNKEMCLSILSSTLFFCSIQPANRQIVNSETNKSHYFFTPLQVGCTIAATTHTVAVTAVTLSLTRLWAEKNYSVDSGNKQLDFYLEALASPFVKQKEIDTFIGGNTSLWINNSYLIKTHLSNLERKYLHAKKIEGKKSDPSLPFYSRFFNWIYFLIIDYHIGINTIYNRYVIVDSINEIIKFSESWKKEYNDIFHEEWILKQDRFNKEPTYNCFYINQIHFYINQIHQYTQKKYSYN